MTLLLIGFLAAFVIAASLTRFGKIEALNERSITVRKLARGTRTVEWSDVTGPIRISGMKPLLFVEITYELVKVPGGPGRHRRAREVALVPTWLSKSALVKSVPDGVRIVDWSIR